ncbi:hypothetical protein BLNAU_23882 [Blattamonas nauphoetae]|uniref:Uncharacterized protein n=1 Tax=Blattamonas nauphoetae TaxID=2049346 RepID=A0ABQ9WQ00_9EUKA|nr:hypothetical protein BLNAU_23882 [Blattamonas nauphoetae]
MIKHWINEGQPLTQADSEPILSDEGAFSLLVDSNLRSLGTRIPTLRSLNMYELQSLVSFVSGTLTLISDTLRKCECLLESQDESSEDESDESDDDSDKSEDESDESEDDSDKSEDESDESEDDSDESDDDSDKSEDESDESEDESDESEDESDESEGGSDESEGGSDESEGGSDESEGGSDESEGGSDDSKNKIQSEAATSTVLTGDGTTITDSMMSHQVEPRKLYVMEQCLKTSLSVASQQLKRVLKHILLGTGEDVSDVDVKLVMEGMKTNPLMPWWRRQHIIPFVTDTSGNCEELVKQL